jgi:hypothetical protein
MVSKEEIVKFALKSPYSHSNFSTNYDMSYIDENSKKEKNFHFRSSACFASAGDKFSKGSELTAKYKIILYPEIKGRNHKILFSEKEMVLLMEEIKEIFKIDYTFKKIKYDGRSCYNISVVLTGNWKQHLFILSIIRHLYEFPHSFHYWMCLQLQDIPFIQKYGILNSILLISQFTSYYFDYCRGHRFSVLKNGSINLPVTKEQLLEAYKQMERFSDSTKPFNINNVEIKTLPTLDFTYSDCDLEYEAKRDQVKKYYLSGSTRKEKDNRAEIINKDIDEIKQMLINNLSILYNYLKEQTK